MLFKTLSFIITFMQALHVNSLIVEFDTDHFLHVMSQWTMSIPSRQVSSRKLHAFSFSVYKTMVNKNMLIDRQLSSRPQNGSFDHNIPLMIFTSLLSINTGRILLENYIDDQNQKECRGSTEDLQLFYGHPSGSCIFPFIFNETRYS